MSWCKTILVQKRRLTYPGRVAVASGAVIAAAQDGRNVCCVSKNQEVGVERKGISILIVEDDDDAREALFTFLGVEFTCFAAATAEEAMRLIGARNFNLVLTDIHLPGASGLELCRFVYTMSPDTVMMVMTGMADIRYRSKAIGQGVLYCIEKPVDLHKLLVWIESGLKCQELAAARHRDDKPVSNAFRTHWLKAS